MAFTGASTPNGLTTAADLSAYAGYLVYSDDTNILLADDDTTQVAAQRQECWLLPSGIGSGKVPSLAESSDVPVQVEVGATSVTRGQIAVLEAATGKFTAATSLRLGDWTYGTFAEDVTTATRGLLRYCKSRFGVEATGEADVAMADAGVTLTAAQLSGPSLNVDAESAADEDLTLPLATALVADLLPVDGATHRITLVNNGGEAWTLTANTGTELHFANGLYPRVIPGASVDLLLRRVSSSAVTCYVTAYMRDDDEAALAQVTEAGAHTYTVTELQTGYVDRDPNGAARADVTPTAALLIAEFLPHINSSYEVVISNTGAATEDLTITAGSDVTVDVPSAVIEDGETGRVLFVRVTSTTVTCHVTIN